VNRATQPIRVDRNSPVPLDFQVAQHRAVEHGNHVYRASRYSFDFTLAGW
jgi:hypothetical protein